jgi:hypothetical protein
MNARPFIALGVVITLITLGTRQLTSAASVPNPSFELGTGQPDGWTTRLLGATYTWSSSEAHTGNRSICISNVQAYHSVEWSTTYSIPVQTGQEYRFGAWAKGNSDREAYFIVAPKDANGNWLLGFGIYMPYHTVADLFRVVILFHRRRSQCICSRAPTTWRVYH